jgi:hypothetical protein
MRCHVRSLSSIDGHASAARRLISLIQHAPIFI